MRFVILAVISLFSFYPRDSNYIRFYNEFNDAETLYLGGDTKSAFSKVNNAIPLVSYVQADKWLFAAKLAAELGKYRIADKYLRKSLRQGVTLARVEKDSSFRKFSQTKYYKRLKTDYNGLRESYLHRINKHYSNQIDSLYYLDQVVLRKATSTKAYKLSEDDLKKVTSDSIIFRSLLNLVDRYGFPTEQVVTKESLHGAYVILHHNARMPKNEYYLNYLHGQVEKGQFHPFWYAWAYDQNRMLYQKKRPVYFIGIPPEAYNLSKEEEAGVDSARRSVGIETLYLERLRNKKS